ncbi:MAG: type III-B CRISPR module RAMP protein Cmr6 [Nitrososphaerota archaeon]|nr:type III-B CRISPR module RAMP protein Cmr6 [Nitrososphaerota archaeon]
MIDIDFYSLNNPNLWSYVALAGSDVMIKKAEEEKDSIAERERKILEYIINRTKIPTEKINWILRNIKQALLNCAYEIRSVKINTISSALIGGSETFGKIPFEVGLYFDPILNIPYIPGSTIKGAIRSATFDLLCREIQNKSKSDRDVKEEADIECNRIFGGRIGKNYSVGLVGFTDAYPIKEGEKGYLLYPDVMSPHYKSDTATELDVLPTPIIYLTIAPGTQFQFYLFYRRERGIGKEMRRLIIKNSKDSDLAETPIPDLNELGILDRGLLYAFYRGVGAKTSVGYSRFEVLSYELVR